MAYMDMKCKMSEKFQDLTPREEVKVYIITIFKLTTKNTSQTDCNIVYMCVNLVDLHHFCDVPRLSIS